jgi:hypothetical protein
MAPDIRTYLDALPEPRRALVLRLRNALLKLSPSLRESLNPWSYLTFSSPKVWGLLTIVPHAKHANLQFANGADLTQRFSQMQGTGKRLRHIRFRYDESLSVPLLAKAVRASLALPAKGMPMKAARNARRSLPSV